MEGDPSDKEPLANYFRVYVLESNFSSPMERSVDMDAVLWSHLPEELVVKVLLVLPFRSQAKFQAVSKTWLSLFKSPQFQKRSAYLAFSSGRHVCGLAHKQIEVWRQGEETPAVGRYKVHCLNLAFLPPKFLDLGKVSDKYFRRIFYLQAGLIALETQTPAEYRVCLVNPVNETWRELVPGCPPGSIIEAMSVQPEEGGGHSYKVLVHCAEPKAQYHWSVFSSRKFAIFCSKANVWTFVTLDDDIRKGHFNKELLHAKLLETGSVDALDDLGATWPQDNGDWGRHFQFSYGAGHSEGIVLVATNQMERGCEIRRLNASRTEWETISVVPDNLKARLQPPRMEDVMARDRDPLDFQSIYPYALSQGRDYATWLYLAESRKVTFHVGDVEVAGDIIFIRVFSNLGGLHDTHYLSYHISRGSWEIIHTSRTAHSEHLPFVHHRFFTPRPSIRL